ncbi:hypothetical protein ACLI4Q_05645 [Natrialbaceae archaeon A-CW1-1]
MRFAITGFGNWGPIVTQLDFEADKDGNKSPKHRAFRPVEWFYTNMYNLPETNIPKVDREDKNEKPVEIKSCLENYKEGKGHLVLKQEQHSILYDNDGNYATAISAPRSNSDWELIALSVISARRLHKIVGITDDDWSPSKKDDYLRVHWTDVPGLEIQPIVQSDCAEFRQMCDSRWNHKS